MESGDGDDYLEFSDFSLFYVLPNEIMLFIFGHLSIRDLCCRVSRVCKQWHSISSDARLWRDLYAKQWSTLPRNLRARVDYDAFKLLRFEASPFIMAPIPLKQANPNPNPHRAPPPSPSPFSPFFLLFLLQKPSIETGLEVQRATIFSLSPSGLGGRQQSCLLEGDHRLQRRQRWGRQRRRERL